ncbi:MAG TPA: glutathione S-transferase family protein [Burkholderiales bacterium]|jgi:glutathione S-transferase|nr:glutathione S-transferase family protein [Burkholderiales bacterium]
MYRLVIGNKAYSSWSLRPWLLMKHAGIAFEEVKVSLYRPDAKQVLLSHSGAGKVPVLHDGGQTIWDSLAIAEYLAEKHPDRRLWPADPAARAQARSASAEMHSGFSNLRSQMPMNVRRRIARRPSTEVAADIARIQSIWSDCRKRFGAGGPFLFGAFSIADAMYAPVASRFHTYGVELAEPARAYAQALLALPAFQAWVADAHAEAEVNPQYEA